MAKKIKKASKPIKKKTALKEAKPVAKKAKKNKPVAKSKAAAKPNVKPKAKAANAKAKPKAKPSPKPKVQAKPKAKVQPKAKTQVKPKAKAYPVKIVKSPIINKPIVKETPEQNEQPKTSKPEKQNVPFPQSGNQRPIAHPAKDATPSDKTRYNDDELKEFENLIIGKLEAAKEEFQILKDTLSRNNDQGTDATSGGNTKVLEDGAETAEKENNSQLAARQLKYITNLESALIRIKNKTYGLCSVTGKLIPKERLLAVPHTTQSIEAKMMQQE